MEVITLDDKAFAASCRELAREVAMSGFRPQLIVGIRTGGEYVAREMLPLFPGARLALVELHRPSTPHKSALRRLMAALPLGLLDRLRIVESRVLSLLPRRRIPRVLLPPEILSLLPMRVLVVDDAVDSGVTMLAIVRSLRECGAGDAVLTAAVTVTTPRPAIVPDFALYRNRTLIRFPWSMDMK
ncbi:MAG: hypothetical protein NC411_09500 [Bacteroides sp.]|nr:hypothetical protein [Bacteroides sp.]